MTTKANARAVSLFPIILLAILAGVMVTCSGYSFGTGNQPDTLPAIFRMMDSDYLSNDFTVNSMEGFRGRYFYAQLFAFLGHLVQVHWAYLILTFACNIATALLTGLAARDLFGDWAGPIAICIVMTVAGIGLGDATALRGSVLTPQTFVVPLLIGALWAAMRGRPILCGLASGIAALLHPLLGLETGAVALAALAVQRMLLGGDARSDGKRLASFWPRLLAGGAVFSLFALPVLIPYWAGGEKLSTEQFLQIVVYFRHPHHYLPSSFSARDFRHAAAFLMAAGAALWWLWKDGRTSRRVLAVCGSVLGFILLMFAGGYVFVEIIPTRIWASLQAFRMTLVVKWVGMALIAGSVARLLQGRDEGEHVEAYALLLSAIAPVASAIAYITWAAKRLILRVVSLPGVAFGGILLALAVAFWNGAVPSLQFATLLCIGLLLHAAFASPARLGRAVASVACFGMIAVVLIGFVYPKNPASVITKEFATRPILTLNDLQTPAARLGRWAKANTPEDAVFLTPPDWGQFRIVGERAIVVDFKAFVWAEPQMAEWYERLVDCYGETTKVGFGARDQMTARYHRITDEQILQVQRKYGIAYAVLFSDTTSAFPVVYEGSGMKIVRVEQ